VDGVWVQVNLTAQVQAWVNGESNYGIMLMPTAEGTHGKLASREATASQQPRLDVIVGTGPATPMTITATGTLTGNPTPADDITRTLTRTNVPAWQTASSFVLQPDAAAGEDAYIWEFAKTTNYGNDDETWVATGNKNTSLSLFKFNLSGLPAGINILNASLSLHHRDGNDPDVPVSAHRITNDWEESSVSWNNRKTGIAWNTPGGDYDSTIVSTTNVGPLSNTRYEWDITSLVQGWFNGTYSNQGIVLRTVAAGIFGERLDTSDHADQTRRPRLSISYSCECGNPCLAPQGAGNILMVVSDEFWMTPGEQRKKALFESWGYTVNLISQWDVSWNFDTLAVNNDVVYVSEGIDHTTWGIAPKLVATTLGVVNEEGMLNDALGISNNAGITVGSTLNVTDTSHYITAPFPAGPLEIYNADMEQQAIFNGPAPDLQTLADVAGSDSLVVLESGATLKGGAIAAGRRVMLPLGREANFNLDYLNNNGRLIVQRALQWGTGNTGSAPPIKNLLLVVVDPGSLTAQEAAKKTLIESWGYTVALIDEADSQASYDTALAANDVVYITEDVSSGTVGTKLVNATIGVVTEEDNLSDEFGLSDSIHWGSGTVLKIEGTHYITETLPPGNLTILTATESLADLTGSLAPALQIHGVSTSGPALASVEAGADVIAGRTATGRRVQLPWGGDNFDVNHLNADGKTIMKRAIEWGAGVAPPMTYKVLLVVVDPASLTAHETAKQALMESWGYTVNLIDESASQGDFDAAIAIADVAYVTEDINSGTLGTKLREAPIGVVIEEEKITDEFGISSGETTFTEASIEVTDNTHYITEPFSLGAVTFASLAQPVGGRAGTLAPGLVVLALRPSSTTSMLDVIETGGVLFDTGTAAGRRVKLPWGGNDFDINSLTADGLNIMRRAIEWGAGAGSAATGPLAHWKFDETSGTTAVDSVGGHDGTLNNGPVWSTGQINGALNLDGNNDAIRVTHADTLSLTDTMTFIAWVNASSFGSTYQTIIAKDAGGGASNYWFGTWQQELDFGFFAGGFYREVFTSGLNLQPGTWYQLAASFDNTTDQVVLYVDGVQVHSATLAFSPSAVTADLAIGRSPDGEYWRGLLDDVRIYDSVLPASEIADLYVASGGGGGGGGGGGPTCDGTFRDEFNTQSFDGSDGTLPWAGSWLEIGESDGPVSNKDIGVYTDQSNYQLRIQDNDNGGEGVARAADLTGAASVTLSFQYRRDSLDNSNDYVTVSVSASGTSGPWTELTRFAGSATDPNYVNDTLDLTPYISATTAIRFLSSPSLGGVDRVWFDNIQIQCSP
jgi:hypothetical protein